MFKCVVKNIYGAKYLVNWLIGSLISTLYTTLEPKKEKVKSLMVAVLRKIMLNGRFHEIILGESSRFRWADRHSRSCFGLEPNSSSSFNVGINIADWNKVRFPNDHYLALCVYQLMRGLSPPSYGRCRPRRQLVVMERFPNDHYLALYVYQLMRGLAPSPPPYGG